jgi:hypothetical protein
MDSEQDHERLQPDDDDQDGILVDDEGVSEEDTSTEEITKPFDPRDIRITTLAPTVELLAKRLRNNEIMLDPEFQRSGDIWTQKTRSRLIESMLIRIPLPAFYFDGQDDNKWIVIDGLQRLTTIRKFMVDKSLRLTQLEYLTDLEGRDFDGLPRQFQRRIEETQVTAFIVEQGSPEDVRFNIFRRLNTSGSPLTLQEIRNALNQGPVYTLLKSLAESVEFAATTLGTVKPKRMVDRELVLRFMAFRMNPYTGYKGTRDLDAFLSETMRDINKMSEDERDALATSFLRAMHWAHLLLEDMAFRKPPTERGKSQINKALFEAWSVSLSNLSDTDLELLTKRKQELLRGYVSLCSNANFSKAISQATGNTAQVHTRFEMVEDLIREVLRDIHN